MDHWKDMMGGQWRSCGLVKDVNSEFKKSPIFENALEIEVFHFVRISPPATPFLPAHREERSESTRRGGVRGPRGGVSKGAERWTRAHAMTEGGWVGGGNRGWFFCIYMGPEGVQQEKGK